MAPTTPTTYAKVLARNIRAARSRIGLGQESVATRMRNLGYEAWLRQTVGSTERGRRRPTAEEILGLAAVLETTVTRLMTPLSEDKWIELPSGESLRVGAVVALVTGELPGVSTISQDIQWYKDMPVRTIVPPHEFEGADRNTPTKESELPLVITAIVTSELGVLVGRRNDGKPPWTFIAGEQEPGERNEDTAIREVKEETGLRVQVADVIGERVHPKTKRTMIYIAATPTHGTDVIVGDEDELAEVRWVSLAEADELMAEYGMFGPVHDYLTARLGEG